MLDRCRAVGPLILIASLFVGNGRGQTAIAQQTPAYGCQVKGAPVPLEGLWEASGVAASRRTSSGRTTIRAARSFSRSTHKVQSWAGCASPAQRWMTGKTSMSVHARRDRACISPISATTAAVAIASLSIEHRKRT
jgi:hypothetical protein